MRKYLLVTYLLNLAAFTWAFGFIGLIIGLGLTGGVYFVAENMLAQQRGMGKYVENIPLMVGHTFGVFAVSSLFGNPLLTLAIGVLNVVVVFIFLAIGDLA